jgi:ABC-2 type transport system permease protein
VRTALRIISQIVVLDVAEIRAIYTWRTWVFGWLLRLLCQAAFFALIGRFVGSAAVMRYVLVGNVTALVCLESTIVVISLSGERRGGTLPLLAMAPVSHVPVYLGRGLHWVASGLTSSLIAWLILPPILGVPLPWPRAAYAIPVFLAIAASSYGYGCVLGSVALRLPGLQWLLLNLGYLSVMAFCGVNVPITFWPGGLRAAVSLLPLTHGLAAVRGILAGAPVSQVLTSVGLELAVAAGWFTVAILLVDRLVTAGRRDGSLEFAS